MYKVELKNKHLFQEGVQNCFGHDSGTFINVGGLFKTENKDVENILQYLVNGERVISSCGTPHNVDVIVNLQNGNGTSSNNRDSVFFKNGISLELFEGSDIYAKHENPVKEIVFNFAFFMAEYGYWGKASDDEIKKFGIYASVWGLWRTFGGLAMYMTRGKNSLFDDNEYTGTFTVSIPRGWEYHREMSGYGGRLRCIPCVEPEVKTKGSKKFFQSIAMASAISE